MTTVSKVFAHLIRHRSLPYPRSALYCRLDAGAATGEIFWSFRKLS